MLTGPEGQRRLADVIDNAISYATRRCHPRPPADVRTLKQALERRPIVLRRPRCRPRVSKGGET